MRKSSLFFAVLCSMFLCCPYATAEELEEISNTDPKRNAEEVKAEINAACPGLGLKDYAGQIKVLDAAIQKNQYSGSLLRARARARYALGNYDGALADLNAAIPITDGFPHSAAFNDRVQVLAKLKRYEEALKDCVTARRYVSGSWMGWSSWLLAARVYSQMGDSSSAANAAQEALYLLKMVGSESLPEPYNSELLKLASGKTDKLQQHTTGIDEYLKNVQQIVASGKAPSNTELAAMVGFQKFPENDQEQYVYTNENADSMWASVMRYGENRIVMNCDISVCSLLEQNIKKVFPTFSAEDQKVETKNATIEFVRTSPTVACSEVIVEWHPEGKPQ